MKLTVVLLVINLAVQQITIAQTPPTFQIQHYTTENGLPSNGIKGLEWDEETGFLWIATEAGIARFNGIDFRIFASQNTPFITTERISFMQRCNTRLPSIQSPYPFLFAVRENEDSSTPFFQGPPVADHLLFFVPPQNDKSHQFRLLNLVACNKNPQCIGQVVSGD